MSFFLGHPNYVWESCSSSCSFSCLQTSNSSPSWHQIPHSAAHVRVCLDLCFTRVGHGSSGLVVSSFVVSNTICPSACSQAPSGLSLCNTDPASVQLLVLLPCSAATCGLLTNGSADITTCFLDVKGILSSLAFSVMSLEGYIAMGILVLIFRSTTCLTECFRTVSWRRISLGRVVSV